MILMTDYMWFLKQITPVLNRNLLCCNFAITYRCNSRCSNCNIWKIKEYGKELTADEIVNFFNESKIDQVAITGGEPFLRTDLREILEGLSCKKVINTNGLMPEAIERTIKGLELDAVSISLDGTEKTHDKIRGIRGAFKKAIKSIEILKENRIDVTASFTITTENYNEILKTFKLAQNLGCRFSMRPALNSFYYKNLEKRFSFTADMIDEIERQIGKMLKYYTRFGKGRFFMENIPNYLRNPRKIIPCVAGRKQFFLDPYGNVYPCAFVGQKLGNVKENKIDKILSKNFDKKSCHCWTECEMLASIDLGNIITNFKK